MAEVLSAQSMMEPNPHYHPSTSGLRRSAGSTTALIDYAATHPTPSRSSLKLQTENLPGINANTTQSRSAPSSVSSSPVRYEHLNRDGPSFASTPASSVSLDAKDEDEDDIDEAVSFPSYGMVVKPDNDYPTVTTGIPPPQEHDVEPITSDLPERIPILRRCGSSSSGTGAEDDTSMRHEPSRHVDYLSHEWREEDIWSSWRYITSRRKQYGNSSRLENASWRTWGKTKHRLNTVSPAKLNWLKDCDVTWLYGPLLPNTAQLARVSKSPTRSIKKSASFLSKKPILKKRSLSEIILQRSLSSSSLLKQAAASVQSQRSDPNLVHRGEGSDVPSTPSDFVSYPFTPSQSKDVTSHTSSVDPSGLQTPGDVPRRHIHFSDSVQQCIAIEAKGHDYDEEGGPMTDDDIDDEPEGLVMKTNSSVHLPARRHSLRRSSSSIESRTIAMLPSTTLKYKEEPVSESSTTTGHSIPGSGIFGGFLNSRLLSPSPSQETLRPTNSQSRTIHVPDEDEDEEEMDVAWGHIDLSRSPKSPTYSSFESVPSAETDSTDEIQGSPNLRRTPSGMLMPYEDDEEDAVAAGLFGRVVDTVATARDIAHVIWNVGWRR